MRARRERVPCAGSMPSGMSATRRRSAPATAWAARLAHGQKRQRYYILELACAQRAQRASERFLQLVHKLLEREERDVLDLLEIVATIHFFVGNSAFCGEVNDVER